MITRKQYEKAVLAAYAVYYNALLDLQKWLFTSGEGDSYTMEVRMLENMRRQREAAMELSRMKSIAKKAYQG